MKKPFLIFGVFALLISCHSQLIINDVQTKNIVNSPADSSLDSLIVSLVELYKV